MKIEPLQKDEAYALFSEEHAQRHGSVIVSKNRSGQEIYATIFHGENSFQKLWNAYCWDDKVYIGIAAAGWHNQVEITYAEYLKRVKIAAQPEVIAIATDFEKSTRAKRDKMMAEMLGFG